MNKHHKVVLNAQKYMFENITGKDYDNCPHLLNLLGILGGYPISSCKQQLVKKVC